MASGVSAGCGGDEFGTVDPGSQNERDGATDGKSSGNGGSSSDGSGGAGGVGGTGGAGGSGASGGSSGTGGAGGTGGSAGKDAGSDSSGGKGGTSADAAPASDVRTDADAGRAGDVLDAQVVDVPTGSDGTATQDAPGDSAGRDSSVLPDAAGGDVVCSEPITYYKDADGDGFGVSTETTITCTPPGIHWSVLTGDCRDDLPNVKPYSVNSPDPPLYSSVGYADMGKPQGVSFDYDCTGTEDADPNNAYANIPEPDCAGLLNCTGAGYMAVNPARTGNGINPQCGSTTVKRCTLLLANGAPALCSSTLEVAAPYNCR
jgi:hypothetical protein